jgi:shikimate kinase
MRESFELTRVVSMKNIVLVGFMGTGKTVVAKAIARRLGMRYVSTDELIEAHEGMAIGDIFSKKGEQYFREAEAQVAREVSRWTNAVVDTGGGIVLRGANVSTLRKGGILVCLMASPDVILGRTKGRTHRPLLNVADPKMKIEELLKVRAPSYAKADVRIDTSGLSVDQVVEKIVRLVEGQGSRGPSLRSGLRSLRSRRKGQGGSRLGA